jgi:hypothetical protein
MKQNDVYSLIDFTSYVSRHTQDFTGREWVFKAINNWLSNSSGPRYFLLTGEPGSGKTAIAGRLSQFSQGKDLLHKDLTLGFLSAVHFCSATRATWIDLKNFSKFLALQLGQIPQYAQALLALTKEEGQKQVNIQASQIIGTAINSEIQAVVIQNLEISGPITAQGLFNLIVLYPLQKIYSQGYQHPITVLVDSLDEALKHEEGHSTTIVDLLSRIEELPTQVRFLLTSRLEIVALEPFRSRAVECSLAKGEGLCQSRNDLEQYVEFMLSRHPELLDKLASELSRDKFVETVGKKSDGNFLYVIYLLQMLKQQSEITQATLDKLPPDLLSIYWEFLYRLVGRDKNTWRTEYAPVLGTLAVAQEPLLRDQLAGFTKMGREKVSTILEDVRQFLDVDELLPHDKRAYALYHRSFADFLLNEGQAKNYWCEEQEQHKRISNYYKDGRSSWDLVNLREIGHYGLHFLARHLVDANLVKELQALLSVETSNQRNAWFDAKNRIGDVAGFLADVALAWQHAEDEYNCHQDPLTLGLQCRYALIISSINSLASGIQPALFSACLEAQIWTPLQAIAYARRIPVARQRIAALACLSPLLPPSLKEQASEEIVSLFSESPESYSRGYEIARFAQQLSAPFLYRLLVKVLGLSDSLYLAVIEGIASQLSEQQLREVLSTIWMIRDRAKRSEAIANIAPHLSEILLQEILARIRIEPEEQWEVLEPLVSRYSERLAGDAFAIIRLIKQQDTLSDALIKFTPYLPEDFMPKVHEIASQIKNDSWRVEILKVLSQHAPAEQKEQYMHEVLTAAQNLNNSSLCAEILIELAPFPSDALWLKSLEIAQAIKNKENYFSSQDDDYKLMKVVRALAKQLPPSLTHNALAIARLIKRDDYRAIALASLAPSLVDTLRQEVLTEVLRIIETLESRLRDRPLMEVIVHLPPSRHIEALEIVRSTRGESYMRDMVTAIAHGNLSEELFQEVLEIVNSLKDEHFRRHALIGLAPYLPANLLTMALAMTKSFDRESLAKFLNGLAAHLPEALIQHVLAIVHNLGSVRDVFPVEIVYRLVELGHIQEALEVTAQIQYESIYKRKFKTLQELLPRLLERGYYAEALQAVQTFDGSEKINLFLNLIPQLPDSLLPKILTIPDTFFPKIRYGNKDLVYGRGKLLTALVQRLPEHFWPTVLALAKGIEYDKEFAETIATLMPRVPDRLKDEIKEILRQALENYQMINDADIRSLTLARIAPILPEPLLQEALQAARNLDNVALRSKALAQLIPLLKEPVRTEVTREALTAIRLIAPYRGARYRDNLEPLFDLIPYLPSFLVNEAISIVRMVDGEALQGLFLAKVVSYLQPSKGAEILREHIKEIRETFRVESVQSLDILINEMPESLLEEMLPDVHESLQLQTVMTLAARLPESLKSEIIDRLTKGLPDLLLPLDQLPIFEYTAYKQQFRVDRVGGNYWAVKARLEILPLLTEQLKTRILQEALEGTRLIAKVARNRPGAEYAPLQACLFLAILPYLSESMRSGVLKEAEEVLAVALEEHSCPSLKLDAAPIPTNLVQLLPEPQSELDLIQFSTPILAGLVQYLLEPLRTVVIYEALSRSHKSSHKKIQLQTLNYLIPQLTEPLKTEVVSEALSIALEVLDDREFMSRDYLAIFPYLLDLLYQLSNSDQELLLKKLLLAAWRFSESKWTGLSDDGIITQQMKLLLPHLQQFPHSFRFQIWSETLYFWSNRARNELLTVIAVLQPLTISLQNVESMEEIFRSIQAIGRWWP